MNEHEIRDREQIAVLEMLRVATKLADAHTKLLMRHFSEAKHLLVGIKTQIDNLLDLIPEEEGE